MALFILSEKSMAKQQPSMLRLISFLSLLICFLFVIYLLYMGSTYYGNVALTQLSSMKPSINSSNVIASSAINAGNDGYYDFVPINGTNFSYKSQLRHTKNVVSVGCAKDIATYLPDLLFKMAHIGQLVAKNHHIVIYESYSTDNTNDILKQAAISDNKSVTILEGMESSNERTVRLANCRNALMQHVWHQFSDADYMFVYDLDDMFPTRVFELIDYFLAELESEIYFGGTDELVRVIDWDVLTFNRDTCYYDIWALRTDQYPDNSWAPNNYGRNVRQIAADVKSQLDGMKTLYYSVNSAFGGFGIYRLNATLGCEYNGKPNKEIDCEHVAFHYCMTKMHGARHRISKISVGEGWW